LQRSLDDFLHIFLTEAMLHAPYLIFRFTIQK